MAYIGLKMKVKDSVCLILISTNVDMYQLK